jgi:RES domain-containing protein
VDRNLANAVASCGTTSLEDVFLRHASAASRGMTGSDAGGRWGPPGSFPVLYLGRPRDSIVIEAYRRLVDPFPGMTGAMVAPRRLYVCRVHVDQLLDLREAAHLASVGLTRDDLNGPYPRCQSVGQAAHQLGLHGLIAPAATGMGETLALFMRHLPNAEQPEVLEEEHWDALPADPRQLRLVDGHGGAS